MVEHFNFMVGVPESYLADLARVIVIWSHVEDSFDMLFLSLVVMKGRGSGSMKDPDVVQMGYGFQRRVKLFRQRVNELELTKERKAYLKTILDHLLEYRKKRDEIAHALWGPAMKNGQIATDEASLVYKSWHNSKEYEFKTMPQSQLGELYQSVSALFTELFYIHLYGVSEAG